MIDVDIDPAKTLGVKHSGLGLARYRQFLQCDPCAYCGAPFDPEPVDNYGTPYNQRQIDHIVPRSQGGPNHWTNYTAACCDCNWSKFDASPLAWLLRLERLARGDVDGALAIRIGGEL